MNRRKARRFLRRGRTLGALGAVEGEKVEYFLPASIVNAIGGGKAIAFCAKSVEDYFPVLEYQSRVAARKAERAKSAAERLNDPAFRDKWGAAYADAIDRKAKGQARAAKTREKAGDIFAQTLAEMQKDLAAVRAKGITGPIPVCIYRATGKWGDRLKTAEKRATVNHERFHADARREEYKLGVPSYSCDSGIAKAMAPMLDAPLVEFSRRYWTPHGRAAGEEILARAEEVIHACDASTEDCSEVIGRVNDWFVSKRRPELAQSFAEAVAAVKARHGRPIDVFRSACKVR
jgi:hypothetical protein